MIRRIGRAIFAVLMGLSVAIPPATIGFAAGVATAADLSAAVTLPDCDHGHMAPNGDTQKTAKDSACAASCALSCFNFVAPSLVDIALTSSVDGTLKPVRVTSGAPSHMGSPPFRPPRV